MRILGVITCQVAAIALINPRKRSPRNLIAIEAGLEGWEIIEKKELLSSLGEYIGYENTAQVKLRRSEPYLKQVRRALAAFRPTHYLLDFRYEDTSTVRAVFKSIVLLFLFCEFRVTPLVILTDLPPFRWRLNSVIVTSIGGLIVTLMSARWNNLCLGCSRTVGPSMMGFSSRTLAEVQRLKGQSALVSRKFEVGFVGSLYEPRTSELNSIAREMAYKGLKLQIETREPGGARVSDQTYWLRLFGFSVLITTAGQVPKGSGVSKWPPHLIWRYTEALVAGQFLLAPYVEGMERWFLPGRHFVAYRTPDEAAALADFYLQNELERLHIAHAGHLRVRELIETKEFWRSVDQALHESGQKTLLS